MIIAMIQTFPLRNPFKPETRAAASAWGIKTARRGFAARQGDNRPGVGRLGRGFWFSRGAVG